MDEVLENLPKGLAGFVKFALKIQVFLISIFTLIMGVTFFFVVVFRYGFRADLFAYEEWLLIICFWLYFLGSAVGTYEKVHINADLLTHIIENPKIAFYRTLLVHIIELGVTLVLLYWSVMMILDELSFYPNLQATNALRIPFILPRLAMPVGFAFMAFYTLLHIYVEIKTRHIVDPPISEKPPEIP
ncbi:TRAP transporter small permease [Shimia sediminis]|uniref:TRAP transporter small permease n=1 Tax=Shimia sediminis TaxID=2497945 RepID=UPI000F8C857C|nr:TRAP transporter small permease subunit [Shimia sediminis]